MIHSITPFNVANDGSGANREGGIHTAAVWAGSGSLAPELTGPPYSKWATYIFP